MCARASRRTPGSLQNPEIPIARVCVTRDERPGCNAATEGEWPRLAKKNPAFAATAAAYARNKKD